MENTTKQRRSSIKIMGKMIGLVKPLAHIMTAAVLLGTLGYLCAMKGQRVTKYLIILVVLAVMRGILHYAEQYCNHFIAFKLLAIIRHQVFAVLRKLCPAKLDGREKGNLISIITTDIELLEVFYAHTISPIMIAILTSLIMVVSSGRLRDPIKKWKKRRTKRNGIPKRIRKTEQFCLRISPWNRRNDSVWTR